MSLTPKVNDAPDSAALTAKRVAAAPVDEVLHWLDSSPAGLSSAEASARLVRNGPNAVRTHHVNALAVLGRQMRNAVLILLAGTAIVSYFLGDIDILITDKTGTLTEGRIRLVDTIDQAGAHAESVRRLGLLATDVDPESGGVGANPLDAALWESRQAQQLVGTAVERVAILPFDHERRATSVLVDDDGKRVLVVKGAPEQVLARCQATAAGSKDAEATLATLFAAGAGWWPWPSNPRPS
jgi:magnesium-transporting ATPase (P-type)